MSLINNLKEREQFQVWRKRHRIRLIDVSEYCGCCVSTLSQFENSQTNLSDKLLAKYIEFINQFEKGKITR